MTCHPRRHNDARFDGRRKDDWREVLAVPAALRLGQHLAQRADLAIEVVAQRPFAMPSQPRGAVLDDVAGDLRHTRGRRAGPRRIWEDVETRDPALINEIEGAAEHVLGLGREPGNDVGAEHQAGTQPAQRFA